MSDNEYTIIKENDDTINENIIEEEEEKPKSKPQPKCKKANPKKEIQQKEITDKVKKNRKSKSLQEIEKQVIEILEKETNEPQKKRKK